MADLSHLPLQLDAVSYAYGQQVALEAMSLVLPAGQVTALLGQNGAGKSTLMGLLTGRLQPTHGRLKVWGQSPTVRAVRQRLGVMLQTAGLAPSLRVAELVALVASYYPTPLTMSEIREVLALAPIWKAKYADLSGGQQRLVQFALAVCGRPELLLLDEPSVGLDVESRCRMWALLRQFADAGCAILVATHHLDEAEAVADHVIVLQQGRVVLADPLRALRMQFDQVTLRCRTGLSPEWLAQQSEVIEIKKLGEQVELQLRRPEPLLARMLAADPELDQLEVYRPNLESIFASVCRPPISQREVA